MQTQAESREKLGQRINIASMTFRYCTDILSFAEFSSKQMWHNVQCSFFQADYLEQDVESSLVGSEIILPTKIKHSCSINLQYPREH
jgi:hypothetical protein